MRRAPDGDGLLRRGGNGIVREGARTGVIEARGIPRGIPEGGAARHLKLTVTAQGERGPIELRTEADGEARTNRVARGADGRWRPATTGCRLFEAGVFDGDARTGWNELGRRIEGRGRYTDYVLEEAASLAREVARRLRDGPAQRHRLDSARPAPSGRGRPATGGCGRRWR